MCVQYWPAAKNREEVYGGVGITVEHEEQLANFMIRTIKYAYRQIDRYIDRFAFNINIQKYQYKYKKHFFSFKKIAIK